MSQFSQRLIFGEGGVLLQDLKGKVIRTFQKSDFRISERHYRVTESLLGEISGNLLIEIDVPIAVEVTFVALIKAISRGAIAYANEPGAKAYATADGAIARATTPGAKAYANALGAEAHAITRGAKAYANAPGSKAYADEAGAIARACAPGADACENARGAIAYACVRGSFVVLLS